MTMNEIKSLFVKGLQDTKLNVCMNSTILTAMVILSGCAAPQPSSHAAAPNPLLIPKVQPHLLLSQIIPIQTNSAIVVAGQILEVSKSTKQVYTFKALPMLGINYTNTFPDMQMGDWGISGITWGNGYGGDVVVWIHTELIPFLTSQADRW